MIDGYIYFIGCETPLALKIGFTSKHPVARLKQLQTGSPMQLLLFGWYPGTMDGEKELHRKMAHLRMVGEWFAIDDSANEILRGPFMAMHINNRLTGYNPDSGCA